MARLNVLKSFYASIAWQNFRVAIIAERGLVCEHCGQIIIDSSDATIHHIEELTADNVHDVNIALNPKNVLVVHRGSEIYGSPRCHDKIHGRYGYQEKAVYIVFGCPLSGKETYVKQNMRRGDIVISMDSLYEAITGLPSFDKPDQLLNNVRTVYNTLIDQVKTRFGRWNNAYIIGGFPDASRRERLADELGAEIIFCECSKELAVSRIDLDDRRRNMKHEYVQYIDKWFEQYSA